jgi:hypothetical protein
MENDVSSNKGMGSTIQKLKKLAKNLSQGLKMFNLCVKPNEVLLSTEF